MYFLSISFRNLWRTPIRGIYEALSLESAAVVFSIGIWYEHTTRRFTRRKGNT